MVHFLTTLIYLLYYHCIHANDDQCNEAIKKQKINVNSSEWKLSPNRVVMDSNFKWGRVVVPIWTSVFLGTNDSLPHLDNTLQILSSFESDELALVTVVGGGAYLRILEHMEFSSIHFFDANVNELSKLRLVHDDIIKYDYDTWIANGGMQSVANKISSLREKFYLPAPLLTAGVTLHPATDFEWPIPGQSSYYDPLGRRNPLWSIFPPLSYPEYAWKPTRKGYERVRRQLKYRVANEFYLSVPCGIIPPNILSIVYVDGIKIPKSTIRAVSRSGDAIGLWSMVEDQKLLGRGNNSDWSDSHFFWELAVRWRIESSTTVINNTRIGMDNIVNNVMHIWAIEDINMMGTIYDWMFTSSMEASSFASSTVTTSTPNKKETEKSFNEIIVFHILLGKATTKTNCSKREELFMNALIRAVKEPHVRNVLVTEHNTSSKQFDILTNPCALNAANIRKLINKTLSLTPDNIKTKIIATRFLPGGGTHDRNVLFDIAVNEGIPSKNGNKKETFLEDNNKSMRPATIQLQIDENTKKRPIIFPYDGSVKVLQSLAAAACMDIPLTDKSYQIMNEMKRIIKEDKKSSARAIRPEKESKVIQ